MRRGIRPLLAAVVAAVLAIVGVVVVLLHDGASAAESACARTQAASTARAAIVTGHGPRTLVIGDSWSAGYGLWDIGRSFPAYLPGRVHVAAFSGSGFSEGATHCARESYADRAPEALRGGAALVVVEGGLNDTDQPPADVVRGFHRLMGALQGHRVVVIGPTAAPKRGASVAPVDTLLARLCAAAKVPYLSTLDVELPYQADRLHPTADGARIFGEAVARWIGAQA
jgi:acyl-CoA thioesterase I